MSDIFEQTPIVADPINDANVGGKTYTGNPEIDQFINSLPEEERDEAFQKITAPKTGEEIAMDMMKADQAKVVYDPSYEDWLKLKAYQETIDNDNLELLTKSAAHIYELFTKAAIGAGKEPTKVPAGVVEAFAQGTKSLYGVMAMSADSSSIQSKFFNAINGIEENSQEAYNEFLRARNVVRELNDLWDGTSTMIMNKDLINHDFVQGASMVADASMIVPFGKVASASARFLGMGEKALVLQAKTAALKSAVIGGAVKWGVGAPVEFVGRAVRGTIDYGIAKGGTVFESAVGVTAKEFEDTVKSTMRVGGIGSIGAGAFGYSIPYASSITGAYTYANAAVGVGEALGAVGTAMRRGPRGLASYAADALKMSSKEGVQLTPHAKNLLTILDKFDPIVSYAGAIGEGMAKGSIIGAGIGYWAGGRDGLWSGIGAGMALGSLGGGFGKMISDVTGQTRKTQTGITAKYVLESMKDIEPLEAMHWENAEIFAKANGFTFDGLLAAKDRVHPKTSIRIYNNEMFDKMLLSNGIDPKSSKGFHILPDGEMVMGKKQFTMHNGYVIENKANGQVRIYINAESAGRPTLGHEIFHSVMRTSVLKDLYIKGMKDKVLGIRDQNGNFTQRPVVDKAESSAFFRRYLQAEYRDDPAALRDAMARLEVAEREFKKDGTLINDPDLGRPLLEHLSEEFGAYYFSHLLMDKPIDWMYHGGEFSGIRGALDSASMAWMKFMKSRVGDNAVEFDFNRTFKDPVTGLEKPVTIDQVFAPLRRTFFGGVEAKRVVNPALDAFFTDVMRMEKRVNETGGFDISKMTKENQKAFIEGNGLDGVFERNFDGTYKPKTQAQIKRENKFRGKEVYKLLMGVPMDKRTFKVDADGSIRGPFSDEIIDMIVNSGHMSREMANKVRVFQNIAEGRTDSNIVDFGGIGATMEMLSDGSNPPRLKGNAVPFKMRTGVVFGLDVKISPRGEFEIKGNMLDYDNIQTRGNNQWRNPIVQMLWNGNHTNYMTDLFRYLENASKDPNDSTRVPSADLWVDGKGAERRNVMHQIMGMAKGEADTYLNPPNGEIKRNHLSTVMSFSLNRMTNLRVRDQKLPFTFKNAYKDIVRNFHPRELDGEPTPNGINFKHPSGYTFLVKMKESQSSESAPYNSVEVFDDKGIRLGRFNTMDEAAKVAAENARKNPPMIMNSPILRGDSFGNEYDLREYAVKRGYNELGYVHASDASDIRVFDVQATPKNRRNNPAGIYFRRTSNPSELKQYGANLYTVNLSLHNPWGLDGRTYLADGSVKGRNRITKEMVQDLRFILQSAQKKNSALSDGWVEGKIRKFEESGSFTWLGIDQIFGPNEMRDFLVRHGFDGLDDGMDKAVFFPEQIKSDKLITKDANGNVIPKSERFNKRSADINRSPNEGAGEAGYAPSRNYTNREFSQEFIGRYARENPDLVKGLKVEYLVNGGEGVSIMDKNGNTIAKMGWRTDKNKTAKINISNVVKKHQGKGYGNLLYSEAVERMRELGIKRVEGDMSDDLGRPIRIRENIIDKENARINSRAKQTTATDGVDPMTGESSPDFAQRLKSNLDERAWYSPNEGAGEAVRFPSSKKYEPVFKDSYLGYGGYFLPSGSDPFPMIHPLDFDKDINGKTIKLDKQKKPSPHSDSLYHFMKWHQTFEEPLRIREILEFLDRQGSSVHSNIARSYWSNWARTLLTLGSQRELDRIVTLGTRDSFASSVETVIGLSNKKSRGYDYDPTSVRSFDPNLIEDDAPVKKDKNKDNKDVGEEFGESDSEGQTLDIEKTEDDEGSSKKKKPFRFVQYDIAHQSYASLTLQQIIDKMYAREGAYPTSTGDGKTVTYSTSQSQLLWMALQGRSFEGIALEEIGHTIEGRISREAIARDTTGLLKQIDSQGEGNTSGKAWIEAVEKYIDIYEKRLINDPTVVDPINLAYARFLKLFKEVSMAYQVKNERTGQISNLWDPRVIEHNKNYIKVSDKGKVTLDPKRGNLKKGWVTIPTSQRTSGNTMYMSGTQMALDIGKGGRYGPKVASFFSSEKEYRLAYPAEFFISLLNDPQFLAQLSGIEVRPDLLNSLDTDAIRAGFSPNVAHLHNQMSSDLARFLSIDGVPKYSIANQLLEEVIRILDLNRQGSRGDTEDIARVSLDLGRENPTAFLPDRPQGFLTPSEKEHLGRHREALKAWKEKGLGEDFSEGLSDWQLWEELKNRKDNSDYWMWYFRDGGGVELPDRGESAIRGVSGIEGIIRPPVLPADAKKTLITDKNGRLDVVYIDDAGNIWDPETGKIDKKKTLQNKEAIDKELRERKETQKEQSQQDETQQTEQEQTQQREQEQDTGQTQETDETQIPPERRIPPEGAQDESVPLPPSRNLTREDYRVWRDWIPADNGTKNSMVRNALNYAIMYVNGKYRLYNPSRQIIGIYNSEEEAKRRAMRERPKR